MNDRKKKTKKTEAVVKPDELATYPGVGDGWRTKEAAADIINS